MNFINVLLYSVRFFLFLLMRRTYFKIYINVQVLSCFFHPFLLFRNVFPEGLPPSYVFVSTQRFKVKKTWDLWRILSLDKRPQIAVTVNGEEKTLSFTTTSLINGTQVITFAAPHVKVRSMSLSCWNASLGTRYSSIPLFDRTSFIVF